MLELQPRRTSTALFERCAAATAADGATAAAPARSWFGRKTAEPEAAAAASVDIKSYIVRVADYNTAVPENVYLAAGGPGKAEIVSFSKEQQKIASQNLQQSLASLAVFDTFIDTDGDLSFSDYTRIALLGPSGLIVVPSEASFLDYNRILSFLDVSNSSNTIPVSASNVAFAAPVCLLLSGCCSALPSMSLFDCRSSSCCTISLAEEQSC